MRADIFIMTTFKGPRRRSGLASYLIRAKDSRGVDHTLNESIPVEEGTENGAEVIALLAAIRRLNEKGTELHIYPERPFLGTALEEWSKKWIRNGFVTAKGKPVEYSEEWREILDVLQDRETVFHIGEQHEFRNWMKGELKKCQESVKGSEGQGRSGT